MTPSTTTEKDEFEAKLKSIPWRELAGQPVEIFVDSRFGDDGLADGSSEHPCRTIAQAMELVCPSDATKIVLLP